MDTNYEIPASQQEEREVVDSATQGLRIVIVLKIAVLLYFIALLIPAFEGLTGTTGDERLHSLSICLLVAHIGCAELAYRANSRIIWTWYLLLFGIMVTMVGL
jgi:hypothetical protein